MTGKRLRFPRGVKISARGYIKEYFDTMLHGLTGHLHELFYPFDTDCWSKASFQDGGLEGWWPYEQVAYWLDGYVKCACFAECEEHLARAKGMIDDALRIVDERGFIGARELAERGQGNAWVHAVFLRAVMCLYEITGDPVYLNKVKNHYLSGASDYSSWRESVNIENIVNCYLYTGEEALRELAVSAYRAHCEDGANVETKYSDLLRDDPIKLHAVTYDEMVKIPALLYLVTDDVELLRASIKGIERIEKNHMLPIGIHSGCESFVGRSATSAFEVCDITDFCWSLGYLGEITGEVKYFDAVERIMLNVAPSVMDREFKTLQYFSSMNQVISTHNSNHTLSFTFTPRMAYQSDHYPECCTGNANRSMPNFLYRALSEWDGGYALNFYLPAVYKLPKGELEVITDYPFADTVKIVYRGENLDTRLALRIPGWCESPEINVPASRDAAGRYTVRGLRDGDEIVLRLPSALECIETEEGLMVQKQPLVYTLDILPRIAVDKTEPRVAEGYPAYDVTPLTPWQIALDRELLLSSARIHPCRRISLLEADGYITAKGYLMEGVELERTHTSLVYVSDYDKGEYVKMAACGQIYYEGELLFTPKISDLAPTGFAPVDIRLVPYSAAMLRWTVFPNIKNYKI